MSNVSISSQVFLGRQPILDRDQRLVAYELLFRNGEGNFAHVTNDVQATAQVITNTFAQLTILDVLGNCKGFINVDEAMLFHDVLELLPAHSVVLELLETVPATPAVLERANALKAMGFTLALDDFVSMSTQQRPLLDVVDIVKVDVQHLAPADITRYALTLMGMRKKIVAEKVDSREQMEFCLGLGFAYFQGFYFARPTVLAGKKLDHSQLALMKLMGLLQTECETSELEEVFKLEPGLAINLLRLTNSVGSGMSTRITSLRHAITVLGRRQLKRWLQLLLFASPDSAGGISPLLTLAATRGRLMEEFAEMLRPKNTTYADQAFMVGIMSLMPAVVNQPMAEIVGMLGLDADVGGALCEGKGVLGDLLKLTELLERNDLENIHAPISRLPGLDISAINLSVARAMSWANQLAQERV